MDTKEIKRRYLADLQARKAASDEKAAPFAAHREQLWGQVHLLKAEIDQLAAKEKEIRGEDYHALCQEIGKVAKELGARALGDSAAR